MLVDFDILDISNVIKILRDDVQNQYAVHVIEKIIRLFDVGREDHDFNQVRIALAELKLDRNGPWGFVYHNNRYVTCRHLNNPILHSVLRSSFDELKKLLQEARFEQAELLLDCIHNLPEKAVYNNFQIPSDFWINEIKLYRKRYNKTFLNEEELHQSGY